MLFQQQICEENVIILTSVAQIHGLPKSAGTEVYLVLLMLINIRSHTLLAHSHSPAMGTVNKPVLIYIFFLKTFVIDTILIE